MIAISIRERWRTHAGSDILLPLYPTKLTCGVGLGLEDGLEEVLPHANHFVSRLEASPMHPLCTRPLAKRNKERLCLLL